LAAEPVTDEAMPEGKTFFDVATVSRLDDGKNARIVPAVKSSNPEGASEVGPVFPRP